MGIVYLLMGLLFVPFFLVMMRLAPGETGFGTPFVLAMPVLYSILGIVVGTVGATIYNLVSGWIGGIEIEIDPA